MSRLDLRDIEQQVVQAGYKLISREQPRANRLVLTLKDDLDQITLVLVQARPLISTADVHDLALLTQLRRPYRGFLLAYHGSFTPLAHATLAELRDPRLRLCTSIPLAQQNRQPDASTLRELREAQEI